MMKPIAPILLTSALLLAGCGSGADDYKIGDTSYIAYTFDSRNVQLMGTFEPQRPSDITSTGLVFEDVGTSPDGRRIFFGICEVSREQWEAVMDTRPWEGLVLGNFSAGSERSGQVYPAYGITFEEAQAFVERVAEQSGLDVRLADYDLLTSGGFDLAEPFASREETTWFEPVYRELAYEEVEVATEEENGEVTVETVIAPVDDPLARIQYGEQIRHLFGNVREWSSDGSLRGGGFGDNRTVVLVDDEVDFDPAQRHLLAGLRVMVLY